MKVAGKQKLQDRLKNELCFFLFLPAPPRLFAMDDDEGRATSDSSVSDE